MATYIVDTTSDAAGDTLRAAITAANGSPGADIIVFQGLGSGATITLSDDLPQITGDLVIDGSGAPGLTISGAGLYRVFWAGGFSVEIRDLTIADGLARGGRGGDGSSSFAGRASGGGGAGLGGGVLADGTDLTLVRVTFSGNGAVGGDAGVVATGTGFGGGGGGMDDDAEDHFGGGPAGGVTYDAGMGIGMSGGAYSGGHGGIGSGGDGGHGGFAGGGAGGGGASGRGGNGGFGGAGGGGQGAGGTGGYGAGDGSGLLGGGGAGLGGAVFVRSGGSITLEDVTFGSGNSATGGAGFEAGAGEGAGLFLMGGGALGYSVDAGQTATVSSSVESDGAISLTKNGGGTLVLDAANDFSGFTVGDGTLQAASARLGANVAVSAGATLELAQASDATWTRDTSGAGEVIKTGAGVLTVSGTLGNAGGVSVDAGTLRVTGNVTSSGTTVASGGTLEGTGAVASVSVQAGGTLAPGASPGTLSVGDLTLLTGATLEVELGGTGVGQFDRLNVTGTVTLGGAFLDIQLYGGFTPAVGTGFLLIDNDGADAVSGEFSGFADDVAVTIGGLNYTVSYDGGDGNDVVLTVSAAPPPAPPPIPTAGGSGNDLAILNDAGTSYSAGDGDDMVMADGGDDFVHGNAGNDTLHGGWGDDSMHGGQGNDVLYGDDGDDVLFGDRGDDFIHGGKGDDVVDGGEGSDALAGGQGDDVIRGGEGDDILSGDRGNDTLIGGAGADVFRFAAGGGADVVLDFSAAEGDRVQVAGSYVLSQVGDHVLVDLGGGDTLTLLNVQLAGLPEGWIFG